MKRANERIENVRQILKTKAASEKKLLFTTDATDSTDFFLSIYPVKIRPIRRIRR